MQDTIIKIIHIGIYKYIEMGIKNLTIVFFTYKIN